MSLSSIGQSISQAANNAQSPTTNPGILQPTPIPQTPNLQADQAKAQADQAKFQADQATLDKDNLALSKLPANRRQDSNAVIMAQKLVEIDEKALGTDQIQLFGDQFQQMMDTVDATLAAAPPPPSTPTPSQPPQNPFDPYGMLRKHQPDQI